MDSFLKNTRRLLTYKNLYIRYLQTPITTMPEPRTLAFSLGVVILLSSVIIIGCQKEAIIPDFSILEKSTDATPLVKAFIERAALQGADKRDVTLSMDSAEWYIEAALNYSLSEGWVSSDIHRKNTLVIELTCDQDGIRSSVVNSAYLSAVSALGSEWDQSEHLILADVILKDLNGSLTLEIISLIGIRGGAKVLNTNFGTNDYYYAMLEVSHPTNCGCGPNLNGLGKCSAKQIESRLNVVLGPISPGEYFTNIDHSYLQGAPFFWTCPDNCWEVCLGPTELSALVTSGWNGFNYMVPSNRTKISIEIQSIWPMCCTWAEHLAEARYGVKQSGSAS